MEYLWIAAGVFILFLVHKLILAPMRHLVVNVVVGLIVLYGVNHFGYLFGFQHVPITIGTGLIIGCSACPVSDWLPCITRFFNLREEGIS